MNVDEARVRLASVWRSRAHSHLANAFTAESEGRAAEARRYHAMADHAIDEAQRHQPLGDKPDST